ncbi:MAG TPA: nitroreductase family deazaflavin-dependent oxidoreductase [Candidatus Limnocylindria bacterium]|nr:nitroreductase family deazaflavin-dependent oxidoreductase [Candidatus Limnocylindria bacterium]
MPNTRRAPTTRMAWMRPFTTRFVNPITRVVAGRLPWFGILHVKGRKSGKRYDIPMNAFRQPDGTWVFALTYGSEVQWVKNVLAAGECTMTTRGRRVRLTQPELFVDPKRSHMPLPVRLFLGPLRVTEFLRMREAPPAG